MVQKHAVYRKSPRGAEALAKRDPALSLRLRSFLILVDGKRSTDELSRMSSGFGDCEQLLSQLDALGMVELAAAAGAEASDVTLHEEPTAPQSIPAPLAASRPVSLADAKRAAVRRLTDLLGPTAEDLCLRIEGAKTGPDFQAALKRAEVILRDVGGPRMATTFVQEMQWHQPA
jgi:hypothetical protein